MEVFIMCQVYFTLSTFENNSYMTMSTKSILTSLFYDTCLTYSTIKLVKVPHTYVAVIYRIVQILVLFYIIGYIVIWKKGYQQFEEPHGTSVIKVKGVAHAYANRTLFRSNETVDSIWDTAEYEMPPIENNAFFIATHQTVTYDEKVGICPTALSEKLFCSDSVKVACKKNEPTPSAVGFFTGNCVSSRENSTIQVCEMNGWCPEELSDSIDFTINQTDLENFTIFLKTMVSFTSFKKKLRNIRDNTNFSCRFDGTPQTVDCPVIPLGYILSRINTDRVALLEAGGLIEIRQDWTCNFDRDVNKCIPKYEFSLLQSGNDKLSPGINYRYAEKYRINNTNYRILSKVYGLRFIITITGRGGQFNIVNLFVAIGSGIGFLAIASIVADVFLVYVHKFREVYRQGKYSVCEINEDNAVLPLKEP